MDGMTENESFMSHSVQTNRRCNSHGTVILLDSPLGRSKRVFRTIWIEIAVIYKRYNCSYLIRGKGYQHSKVAD